MSIAIPDSHFEQLEGLDGDERIVEEAKKRWKYARDYESTARLRFIDDVKFCNADSLNGYQWPEHLRSVRGLDRPSHTLNKTRQHCLQIINDAKQNKPSVKIRPVGDGASFDAAEVYEGIVRHIEYISNAGTVYDQATTFQVQGGIGYWRIITDWEHDESTDQELKIVGVKDPLSIYLDPDAQQVDKGDARWGFVFRDEAKDKFLNDHPRHKDMWDKKALGNDSVPMGAWMDPNHIRIAEYYRVVDKKKHTLYEVRHPDGTATMHKSTDIPPEQAEAFEKDKETTRSRDVYGKKVEWYLIAGDKIIDRKKETVFEEIPIIPVIGTETVIDGILDRAGHTRALRDPQIMYNFWASSATEHVALQTKSPFIAPASAIAGHEEYWGRANTQNFAVLPYNQFDEAGNELREPMRSEGPVMAEGFLKGLELCQNEMMMVSGQYQAQMGENENARSGKAISERQRQGDNATYHFIDNLAVAIRRTGRILIKAIPKVYDAQRVIKILAEDGSEHDITIDPNAKQAYQQQQAAENENVKAIFNPAVGRYDIESEVGPNFATRRQEAFNAFEQLLSQNPDMLHIIGDLMFKSADFPLADEIAQRLKRTIPKNILGEGPDPQTQKQLDDLQTQNQSLLKSLEVHIEELSKLKLRLAGKDQLRDIEVFKADTERLKALQDAIMMHPEDVQLLVQQAVQESLGAPLSPVDSANAAGIKDQSSPVKPDDSSSPLSQGGGLPGGGAPPAGPDNGPPSGPRGSAPMPGRPQGQPKPPRAPLRASGGAGRPSLFRHPGTPQVPGVGDAVGKLGEILQAMHAQNMDAHNKSHQIATAPRVVHRTPDGKVAAIAPQLPNQGQ